jgi:nicotinamidase-related amidase/type 1 glutamine amidotransferase
MVHWLFLLTCFASPHELTLHLRTKVETEPRSGRHHTLTREAHWDARKTAVIVCDMWDKHSCPSAAARVNELAPRVNQFITEARRRGALIIHCPSDTMEFYKGHPGRVLAGAAPKVEPKVPLRGWCHLIPEREGQLPIDDSDGGCAESVKSYKAWSRQHVAIEIHKGDAITDSTEAYYLLRQRGIDQVLICGVHTNMCVLGRPFGIRQLVQQGLNVALVRDLTDTMYNPARRPQVSHFTGTDLVVDHIEKHWSPTVTSPDLLGGKEFRFAEDKRPHVVIIAAEDEYQTEITLPKFALERLGRDFRVSFVFADPKSRHRLPGLDQLRDADVLLLSVRRRPLEAAQLVMIREWIKAGKPLVAIRTSSHAFARKGTEKLPAGVEEWSTFDADVLGCHYQGHHGTQHKPMIHVAAPQHALLAGIETKTFVSEGSLYKSQPLPKSAQLLLRGEISGQPPEPVAWTVIRPDRGKTFYTSLGHAKDFENPAFVKLLRNAVSWASSR